MRKREGGQALILVLILLAVGVLLVVPALRLTATALKSSQIVLPRVRALYAADAAQEFILWKLMWDDLAGELMRSDSPNPSAHFDLDVCGALVSVTVYMRATEGMGGITLATDDVIRPTKTVDPDAVPDDKAYRTYTYTIRLEQLSSNTTQGLDAVYDILPSGFGQSAYEEDSSFLRVDGGAWEPIADPDYYFDEGHLVLRWPYSGVFESPIRAFAVRQVKELKFEVYDRLQTEGVYSNWVVLRPWNSLSGATASITVGNPSDNTSSTGMLEVNKTSDPEIIPPGVETDIKYTITITNLDVPTRQIERIMDYLPPGFAYSSNSTSDLTTSDPISSVENINGVDRQVLLWQFSPAVPIQSNETLTLTLWSRVIKNVSGSYYNEVIVLTDVDEGIRQVFENIGVSESEYGSNYSWNTGTVMVPAYDSSANATGVTISANMALILEGITITSWQVD